MTAAPDLDPYLLPLPVPGSPVIAPHLASSLHADLNGRYGDPVWSLAPLTGNPSTPKPKTDWERWPAAFRDQMRLAAWNLINGQLRPTFRQTHPRMRSRPSMSLVDSTLMQWRQLARWLDERGITSLAGCDTAILDQYGQHLRCSGNGRKQVLKQLVALTRLWALDQLSARPAGIARPPWDERGTDDYLPAATTTSGGENVTEPIAEQTIGPLLIWAMRLVEDLSADILAGWAERQRLTAAARASTTTAAGHAALDAYLSPLIASQAPLPATTIGGKPVLARCYIRGLTGASRDQVAPFRQARGARSGRRAASRAVPAGYPGNRADRRAAVAGSARFQRGTGPDAAPVHGRVHRLRLPDRRPPRRETGGIASDAAFRKLMQMVFRQLSGVFAEQSGDCVTSLTKPLAPA
jgi:hypothetical protein